MFQNYSDSFKFLTNYEDEIITVLLEEHHIPYVIKELGDGWGDSSRYRKYRYPKYIPNRGSEIHVPEEFLEKARVLTTPDAISDAILGSIDLDEYPQFRQSDEEKMNKRSVEEENANAKKEWEKKNRWYSVLVYGFFIVILLFFFGLILADYLH